MSRPKRKANYAVIVNHISPLWVGCDGQTVCNCIQNSNMASIFKISLMCIHVYAIITLTIEWRSL